MVALFHIGLFRYTDAFGHEHELIIRTRGSDWGDVGARILGNGPGAVIFFFVLSGFVLTKVLESGSANVPSETTVGNFCRVGCFVFILV